MNAGETDVEVRAGKPVPILQDATEEQSAWAKLPFWVKFNRLSWASQERVVEGEEESGAGALLAAAQRRGRWLLGQRRERRHLVDRSQPRSPQDPPSKRRKWRAGCLSGSPEASVELSGLGPLSLEPPGASAGTGTA